VDERENWQDALPILDESLDRLPPADREILFGRFFEERSFKDIAEDSGSTEAACKMRLKRTLGKLNGWLTGRGVTLSATTLATCLTAEFSKAAPATVTASLPANALAASSGVGAATILTNTLNTMSTAKTAGLAAAIIIAIGSIPIAIQQSQANQLKTKIADLEEQVGQAPSVDNQKLARNGDAIDPGTTPVRAFLDSLGKPLSADELITHLTASMMGRDQGGTFRIMLPLADLTPEEYERLLAEVKASEKSEEMKSVAVQLLSMIGPEGEEDPGKAIDRQLADGVQSKNLSATLSEWAKEDPEAAIAWFEERKGSPEFLGTAVNHSPQEQLFSGLVSGIARVDPERAIAMLAESSGETREIATNELIVSLAGDNADRRAKALELARGIESQSERARAVRSAMSGMAFRGRMAEAAAFANAAGLDDQFLARSIAAAAFTPGDNPVKTLEQQGAWALENTPESAHDELVGELVNQNGRANEEQMTAWVDSLPEGVVRDAGLRAQAPIFTRDGRADEALERAAGISDPALRNQTIRLTFMSLRSRDPEAASLAAERHGYDLDTVLGQ